MKREGEERGRGTSNHSLGGVRATPLLRAQPAPRREKVTKRSREDVICNSYRRACRSYDRIAI